MGRPTWYRILISVWSLWFATALSDLGPLGSCPQHGGHGAMASAGVASHGSHQAHGASHGDATSRPDHSDRSHAGCTCLGACCCVPAVALPGVASSIADWTTHASDVAPSYRSEIPLARAPHTLPFANGPPTSHLA